MTGCAGAQLKSEWKEKRGYSESDITAIDSQMSEYQRLLISASLASNAFNGGQPQHNARNQLKSIFCTCVKKMGDACRKSDGSHVDHDLWVKANAIDEAIASRENAFDAGPSMKIDLAECGDVALK